MANGWTAERRAQQAERIRCWKPWEQSTGPRSDAGKARASRNALKHGGFSGEAREELQELRALMRYYRQQVRKAAELAEI